MDDVFKNNSHHNKQTQYVQYVARTHAIAMIVMMSAF